MFGIHRYYVIIKDYVILVVALLVRIIKYCKTMYK